MIKNIIFDIGNVLLEFKPYEYFVSKGYDGDLIKRCISILNAHWEDYDFGFMDREDLLYLIKEKEYKEYDTIVELLKEWNDIQHPMPLYYKIDHYRKHYKVYLLTNLNEDSYNYIVENYNLFQNVDGAVVSYEAHKVKPDKDIYEFICNKYNLNKDECIFIDDTKENVDAAIKYGIHAIQFTNEEEVEKELKLYVE